MLQIKIGDEELELFPGTSIKYVYNNSAFNEKAIVGNFSYKLSIPDSYHNALVLGFISNPDLYEETTQHDCEIYDDGLFLFPAVLIITDTIISEKISGNIVNSAYEFSSQIKDKTTKDIDLGGTHVFDIGGVGSLDVYELEVLAGSYPDYQFAFFPILNDTYRDGTPVEEDWASIRYVNPYNQTGGGPRLYHPYLAYILDQLFSEFSYNLTNAIGQHSELKKLCLISMGEDDNNIQNSHTYNLHYDVLKVDLTKLLNAIKSTLAVNFYFDLKSKEVRSIFFDDILKSEEYDDWTSKVAGKIKKKIDDEKDGYNISHEFDSSDTTYEEYQLPVELFDEAVIESSVLTPDDLPIYENMGIKGGEIRKVICEDSYWIITDVNANDSEMSQDFQWTRLSWTFFGKKTGNAKTDMTSKLSTLGMDWHVRKTPGVSYTWMTPHADQILLKQEGNDALKGIHAGQTNYGLISPFIDDFEPRVLFFRNMQPDLYDVTYPLGTSGIYNAKGEVIGTHTLLWDGENGLYKKLWEKWLSFIEKSTTYEIPVQLNRLDFLNLDISRKKKIGNNQYLVKSIKIDIPITKAATVTLVRI